MTASLALLTYALAAAMLGPWILRRSVWPSRSPRWGVIAWKALTAATLTSVVLAGVALTVPALPLTTSLADVIEACTAALRAQYATPGGAAASLAGVGLSVAVLGRAVYCFAVCRSDSARERSRQRGALSLVARRHGAGGPLVVEHPASLGYCLPGRRGEVVLTTGALAALTDEQVSAVLAHEHAHLSGRHDFVLTAALAAERAFPWVPTFHHARTEIARLVEMVADDAAARRSQRVTLAAALVNVAQGHAPQGALGAGGDTAVARVRRLLAPADPVGRLSSALLAALLLATAAAPGAILAAPAVAAVAVGYCPFT